MGRLRRGRTSTVAGAAVVSGVMVLSGGPTAVADSPGCAATAAQHCYSVVFVTDTLRYGLYGTWNRAQMASGPSDVINQRFVTSEMWLVRDPSTSAAGWVEAGFVKGWLGPCGGSVHAAFAAWQPKDRPDLYAERCLGVVTPNDSVTDEFQISHSTVTNRWRIYFDGNSTLSADVGWWAGQLTEYGGEVATPYGVAHQFHMEMRAITSSGALVNMGNENTQVVKDPPLYGNRPGESQWNWRIR